MLKWTKAHRTKKQAEADGDLADYLGNNKVDEAAGMASDEYAPHDNVVKVFHRKRASATAARTAVVAALRRYDEISLIPHGDKQAQERQQVKVVKRHRFSRADDKTWVCLECYMKKRVSLQGQESSVSGRQWATW